MGLLNNQSCKKYVNIFETQREIKKRKTLSRTFIFPVTKEAIPELDQQKEIVSLKSNLKHSLQNPSIVQRPLSRHPSIQASVLIKSSKQDLSEESQAYWQGDRFTFGGAVEEVRKSYRESLHAKDYFRQGAAYMHKNAEIQRRGSILQPSFHYKEQLERESYQSKRKGSNCKLPSHVFVDQPVNFNDFYLPAKKIEEPRVPSLVLPSESSLEESGVKAASVATQFDDHDEDRGLAFRFQQRESTVENILKLFQFKEEEKKKPIFKVKDRRYSDCVQTENVKPEVKDMSKEDNLKYRIYFDLEKSASDKKEDSDKSLNSHGNVSIKRAGPRTTLKKGFSMAAAAYLGRMISRGNSTINPEYKGLKKSAIKKLQKKDPIVRQTSIPLQNQFKFVPKSVQVNSFRTFGRNFLIQTKLHPSKILLVNFTIQPNTMVKILLRRKNIRVTGTALWKDFC